MVEFSFKSFLMVLVCLLGTALASPTNIDPASLVRAGHFKQARTLLEKHLAENPKDAEALVLLARVKLAYQDHDEAARLLREAMAIEPGNSDAHVYLAEAYSLKIDHAGQFEKMGIARRIKSESERALAENPNNLDALETLLEFHLHAPGIVGGNRDQASEIAERIAKLDHVRGDFAKAEIAAQEKRYGDEENFYVNAAEAEPHSYHALMAAANFYLNNDRSKNLEKAAAYARKALEIDSSRVRAYTILARVYAVQQRWQELDELVARAVKEVPEDFSPYFFAGQALLLQGKDPHRAEEYMRKYLTQEPEGNAPNLATAHWQLGLSLEQQQKRQDAIQEIETAVRLNPDLKDARKDLQRLKG